MDLKQIQNPDFLKSMSTEDMENLAHDIRTFLIQNIAKTGGHLASNLGVVELTIALHHVFHTPEDKIIFDVGHQSYTHKILTGRAKDFPTLRQYHGLSGFQKRNESPSDPWEAGHSSTSLSAALGMAVARDLDRDEYAIIPVIGDGALSSGMSMEALNQIGCENRNMIIIFNDNNMSISKNVGALTTSFSKLRTSSGYTKLKQNMKRSLRTNQFGEYVYSGLRTVRDSVKNSIVHRGIFGEFNIDYIGPIDGHNIHDLVQVLSAVKNHDGPIVVHVITQKGKGYFPCEQDREGLWHAVGPFDIQTGLPKNSTPEGQEAWGKIIADAVEIEASENPNVVAVTPAMMNGSHLQKFFARYPERSFDTGIAEEHATTFAAGLAANGKRPYLAIYSSFMQRAYDQINHDICRMDLPVILGIDHIGLVGGDGETHHGVFDIGILTALPNMVLAQPKDANEAYDLIRTAYAQSHPFGIRFSKGYLDMPTKKQGEIVPIGSWEKLNDAQDNRVIVFTYGDNVTKLYEKVNINQLPVTIVNCRFFKPIDENMLRELASRKNVKFISYESDMKEHGLGAIILEWCNDHDCAIKLERFAIPDKYIEQGSERLLRKDLHIDLNSLLESIEEAL